MAVGEAAQRVGDIRFRLMRRGNDGEPQLPQRAVRGGLGEARHVLLAERLEPDPAPLQDNGFWIDHLRSPVTARVSMLL